MGSPALLMLVLLIVPGCVDTTARQNLNEGYSALDSRQYDKASGSADNYLQKHPTGDGAAEAYYLRGRVYEQRATDPQASPSVTEKRENLDNARAAYEKGLAQPASAGVQAHLRSGIANIAYFEDDYPTAEREWQAALPNLEGDDAKSWALYRLGICQQRQGHFAQADQTLRQVIQSYPNADPATRAQRRLGQRAFYVQVGAFNDPAGADRAAAALRAKGFAATRAPDASRQIVRVGPVNTYGEAKGLQGRLLGQYPGALIQP